MLDKKAWGESPCIFYTLLICFLPGPPYQMQHTSGKPWTTVIALFGCPDIALQRETICKYLLSKH